MIIAFISMIPAQSGYAQVIMPKPGQMVGISPQFTPAMMMGLRVDVKNPFNLYFVMGNGQKEMAPDAQRAEYNKLIKYFMASLITPNADMWVNLSPKEADRIIPENFSLTEMGRDLLAQDYLLKQFTASLMHPDGEVGKEFWKKIYEKAYATYGTTEIPVDTFNKVWIMADKADIYQKGDTALLVSSHLKVMLERDFMASSDHQAISADLSVAEDYKNNASNKMVLSMVRDVIVPVIEKEVNEGANFAQVRQAYNSMIMATWFKKTLKESLLGQVYMDQNKVAGIELDDPQVKDRIYMQYLRAYKKGVFNFIKEEINQMSNEVLPRRYFSGGLVGVDQAMIRILPSPDAAMGALRHVGEMSTVSVSLFEAGNLSQFVPEVSKKNDDAAQKNQSRLAKLGDYMVDVLTQHRDAQWDLARIEKEKLQAEAKELQQKAALSEADSRPTLFSWIIERKKKFAKTVIAFYAFAFLHGVFAFLPGHAIAFDELTVVKEVKAATVSYFEQTYEKSQLKVGVDYVIDGYEKFTSDKKDAPVAGVTTPSSTDDKTQGDVKNSTPVLNESNAADENSPQSESAPVVQPSDTKADLLNAIKGEVQGMKATASKGADVTAKGDLRPDPFNTTFEKEINTGVSAAVGGQEVERFAGLKGSVQESSEGFKKLPSQRTLKVFNNGNAEFKVFPAGTLVKYGKITGIDIKSLGIFPNKMDEVVVKYILPDQTGEKTGAADTTKSVSAKADPFNTPFKAKTEKSSVAVEDGKASLLKDINAEVQGMNATASKEAHESAKGNLTPDPFNTSFKAETEKSSAADVNKGKAPKLAKQVEGKTDPFNTDFQKSVTSSNIKAGTQVVESGVDDSKGKTVGRADYRDALIKEAKSELVRNELELKKLGTKKIKLIETEKIKKAQEAQGKAWQAEASQDSEAGVAAVALRFPVTRVSIDDQLKQIDEDLNKTSSSAPEKELPFRAMFVAGDKMPFSFLGFNGRLSPSILGTVGKVGSVNINLSFGAALPMGDVVEAGQILAASHVTPLGVIVVGNDALSIFNSYESANQSYAGSTVVFSNDIDSTDALLNTVGLDNTVQALATNENFLFEANNQYALGIVETVINGVPALLHRIPIVEYVAPVFGPKNGHLPWQKIKKHTAVYGKSQMDFYRDANLNLDDGITFYRVQRELEESVVANDESSKEKFKKFIGQEEPWGFEDGYVVKRNDDGTVDIRLAYRSILPPG
ncbi:MAG: hypothetical protein V2A70_02915, partial [Candidatus Omnitrophota bacterium]